MLMVQVWNFDVITGRESMRLKLEIFGKGPYYLYSVSLSFRDIHQIKF